MIVHLAGFIETVVADLLECPLAGDSHIGHVDTTSDQYDRRTAVRSAQAELQE